MSQPLTWMARVLRRANVTVTEYPGWRTRAGRGTFRPRAVMWHHDASARGPSPGMPDMIARRGNTSTPPPLAHAWVDRRGRWHLIAAGRAHHAGIGRGWGKVPRNAGNTYAIGVETDHTVGERWPAAQRRSLRLGTAALLKHMNSKPSSGLCGHKEYAPGRKIDPARLNMRVERREVAKLMAGISRKFVDLTMRRGVRWLGHGDPKIKHNPRNNIQQVRDEIADLSTKMDELTRMVRDFTKTSGE